MATSTEELIAKIDAGLAASRRELVDLERIATEHPPAWNDLYRARLERVKGTALEHERELRDREREQDLAYCDRAWSLMSKWFAEALKIPVERKTVHALGEQLYELLPEALRDRWGGLTPAELGTLALAFPDELPPEARHLLE